MDIINSSSVSAPDSKSPSPNFCYGFTFLNLKLLNYEKLNYEEFLQFHAYYSEEVHYRLLVSKMEEN